MTGGSKRQLPVGFTLIEALMAAVILAIAVAAAIMPFTCGVRTQDVEGRQTLAVGLASDLMEEVLLRPFEEPFDSDDEVEPVSRFGPDSGETSRWDFSAMDDYDGYEEADGGLLDHDGKRITDEAAAGVSRHVTVEYVYVSGQDVSEAPTFMRVSVEVRHNGTEVVKLTRLVHWVEQ